MLDNLPILITVAEAWHDDLVSPLPTPELHGLPEDATIAVPVPAGGLTVHRLLEHEAPSDHDFEPTLSRNQAKLRGVPELFRTEQIGKGHVDVWAHPQELLGAAVDVVRERKRP